MEYVSRDPQPDETVMDYSLLGGGHALRGRRLFLTGMAVLAAALVYLAYTSNVADPTHLFIGLVIFTLSFLPSLLWARSGGSRFPVFETIVLLCANAYAIPVLNARSQLVGYPADVITQAGLTVIAYQVAAILTYFAVRGNPGRSSFWRESTVSPAAERLIVHGLYLSTIYIGVVTFTDWIPYQIASVLRAIFYGIGILCTFVSAQRWGRGVMTQGEKAVFIGNIVPQLIMMSIGLLLIVPLGIIGIGLLGYLSGGKRVPWVLLAGLFAIFAILHTGKTKMREKYWEGDTPAPTITQLPAFFSEWVGYGLAYSATSEESASRKLLERTSLMHILCLVEEYTPERQPYLYGKTYTYVLPQLIPRLFWPEKPRSHIATYELGIYYGLQDEEATETTTIAFGLLAEAYANFGLLGGVLLGFFWGFWLKKLQIWSAFSPMFSPAGLMMILLTAWSFNSELTMAAWVSSFEQAVVVVVGLPMVVKMFFGL